MDNTEIISIVLLIAGVVDFVVMPRVLQAVWAKRGQEPPNKVILVSVLRVSGLAMVVLGFLFRFRVITL